MSYAVRGSERFRDGLARPRNKRPGKRFPFKPLHRIQEKSLGVGKGLSGVALRRRGHAFQCWIAPARSEVSVQLGSEGTLAASRDMERPLEAVLQLRARKRAH